MIGMNYQTLINKNEVVPGGFRFLCHETGVWIKAPSWIELVAACKKHYKANALPIGLEFEATIESQLCSFLPPGLCTYVDDSQKRRASLISRPSVEKAIELTRMFFGRLTGKVEYASIEQATAQARICAGCQYNQLPDGCTSCNASARNEVVSFVLGTKRRETPYHDKLKSCLLCGCDLRAKVNFQPEDIRAIGGQYVAELPDHCWIKQKTI